jgi:hypothetical protein
VIFISFCFEVVLILLTWLPKFNVDSSSPHSRRYPKNVLLITDNKVYMYIIFLSADDLIYTIINCFIGKSYAYVALLIILLL